MFKSERIPRGVRSDFLFLSRFSLTVFFTFQNSCDKIISSKSLRHNCPVTNGSNKYFYF